MDAAAPKKTYFVSARRSPPQVLITIRWIKRDMANRRNLALPPTSCLSPNSFSGRMDGSRRLFVSAVLLIAVVLTMGSWVTVTPQLRRIPSQFVLLVVIGRALAGLRRVRLPRWTLAVVTGILALGCVPLGFVKGIF